LQNFAPGGFGIRHREQVFSSGDFETAAPQPPQNLEVALFVAPHDGHVNASEPAK